MRLTGERLPPAAAMDDLHRQLHEAVDSPVPDGWWRRVGKPAIVGLLVMATTSGLLTYALTGWLLRLRTQRLWWRRARRRRERADN